MKTAYDFRQDGLALEKHREKRAAAKAMRVRFLYPATSKQQSSELAQSLIVHGLCYYWIQIAEEQKVVAAAATTKKPKPKEASLSSTDELQVLVLPSTTIYSNTQRPREFLQPLPFT